MRYKLLGRSGLRVSELGLGTMTFGEEWGWGASDTESRKIFDAYAGAGGNFIDTANRYTNGTSERLVGEFVASDRDHFVVATKYTLFDREGEPNGAGNHKRTWCGPWRAASGAWVWTTWTCFGSTHGTS